MLHRQTRPDLARRVRVYSDPLQHAAIAAVVVAPLAARVGRRVSATAVTAALVIDADHAVAARSIRPRDTTALAQRPRTHSLLAAAGAGALVSAVAGPAHGWAAFAALGSHLLHDAGDDAAPTPVLWPWRPARQLGRRAQLVGTLGLTTASALAGSAAVRARSRAAACSRGADAGASPRTASARS
jgi:membrane-bound metal-dependent hydrolase YbcI (DUF457 family)